MAYAPAMTPRFNEIWPVATFILGGTSLYARDLLSERWQRRREETARRAERRKAVLERREDFELDHLLRLSEALLNLARCITKAHFADMRESHTTGQYASGHLPSDIDEEFLAANRAVFMLKSLVLPDELRAMVTRAHEALNMPGVMHRSDPSRAQQVFSEATDLAGRAQEAIAERVRWIYITASEERNPSSQTGHNSDARTPAAPHSP